MRTRPPRQPGSIALWIIGPYRQVFVELRPNKVIESLAGWPKLAKEIEASSAVDVLKAGVVDAALSSRERSILTAAALWVFWAHHSDPMQRELLQRGDVILRIAVRPQDDGKADIDVEFTDLRRMLRHHTLQNHREPMQIEP